MNVGEIKEEVILMLGNGLADTGHPFVNPTNMIYRWIFRACNKIPRLAAAGGRDIMSTFGELYGEWQAVTALGITYVDRPRDALLVREVYSFDKAGANPDLDSKRLLPQLLPTELDMGRSSTEAAGWPTTWAPKALRIYFRPTPTADFLTDLYLIGVAREDAVFNSDSQTPMLNEDWHEAVMYETARLGAVAMGYWDRAKEYKQNVFDLVTTGVEVPVQEDIYDDDTFDFAGITQGDVR